MAVNDRLINMWMPGELADKLTEDAQSRGWSRAELLRRLAARHLTESKEKQHA